MNSLHLRLIVQLSELLWKLSYFIFIKNINKRHFHSLFQKAVCHIMGVSHSILNISRGLNWPFENCSKSIVFASKLTFSTIWYGIEFNFFLASFNKLTIIMLHWREKTSYWPPSKCMYFNQTLYWLGKQPRLLLYLDFNGFSINCLLIII